MEIGYYIISILFGLIPEVLYFYLFLIYTKNIKEYRIKLLVFIMLDYLVFILLSEYSVISYFCFTLFLFFILKFLYKNKSNLVDIFFIVYSQIYLSLISYICFKFVKNDFSNYYLMLIINRLLLFIPLILKNNIRKFYIKYCAFWNRNDLEKRPIKSITIRNISIVILNIFIYINYLVFTYINTFGGD